MKTDKALKLDFKNQQVTTSHNLENVESSLIVTKEIDTGKIAKEEYTKRNNVADKVDGS